MTKIATYHMGHLCLPLVLLLASLFLTATAACSSDDCIACQSTTKCDMQTGCRSEKDDPDVGPPTFVRCVNETTPCGRVVEHNCKPEMSPIALLCVSLFGVLAIFIGCGCISGQLRGVKLEKEKRMRYRTNGTRLNGVVLSKRQRQIASGNDGNTRTERDMTVEYQYAEANGQMVHTSKNFSDIEEQVYKSCTEQGTIEVVTMATTTGDTRHFMLAAYVDSNTLGLPNTCCMVVLFGIFTIAGCGISFGISLGLILPVEPTLGVFGVVIGVFALVTSWFVARTLINKRFAQLHEKPRGTISATIEMGNAGGNSIVQ